ncbi:MAG: molybdopterin molybdotransferase MoeA [Bacteroidetes bacterium]|nr:molybdopterin molybdotransferase MoeA [Bacteroidota bacterium]
MIQPKQALSELLAALSRMPEALLPLEQAQGLVLSRAVFAPLDVPMFDQSAMDGYACSGLLSEYHCVDVVQAGDSRNIVLKPGECVRIYTGARVPKGTDWVLMQEKSSIQGETVHVLDEKPAIGQNIRRQGSQIRAGERALEAGTVLSPGALGFLAMLGFGEVWVYARPRVGVLVTGNEIKAAGSILKPGEIYESNSILLKSALKQLGLETEKSLQTLDNVPDIRAALERLENACDVLLVTGGISVGDFDLVGPVLQEMGCKTLFYKVAQKPGKPLFVGFLGQKLVIAMPGNPGAVMSCFYVYVWPALRSLMGFGNPHLPEAQIPLAQAVLNPAGRALFLKVKIADNQALVLEKQGSDMLQSFAYTQGLAFIPPETNVEAGTPVRVQLLPLH